MEKSIGATIDIYHSSDAGVSHINGELAVVKHGTELDQEDMARMGKDQVLKVWPYLLNFEAFPQYLSAYLRLLFNVRIFHGPDDIMGGSDSVSCINPMVSATEKCS